MMIANKEYAARRKELMSLMHGNSIAIIASAPEKIRSRDTHYAYKQNVTLSYLSAVSYTHLTLPTKRIV